MPGMKKNDLINISYCPAISREPIEQGCKAKMPLKDIERLGGGFAVMAAAITDAAMNTSSAEGLYRCVFPEGVTGHLATFKNEPQAFLVNGNRSRYIGHGSGTGKYQFEA